ncbi:MAG: CDGSH iron-sulfur domain-containing protein [bacterium]|nr:CDGSH iron-sulfur domain-containing protein [bacterium]
MAEETPKITVRPNGPYIVTGGIPLVRMAPVVSEHGEPLTWKSGDVLSTETRYALCRCGKSANKPFCDGQHLKEDFEGAETADCGPSSARQTDYPGTNISVKDDRSICMHAGFCTNQITNVWQMTQDSSDTQVRAQIMAMVERCPSGALSYSLEPGGETLEPRLPQEIAVTPDGALWVSGGIPIERADGQPFETRNRVTLCRCGDSKNKPLCDGTHKDVGFSAS